MNDYLKKHHLFEKRFRNGINKLSIIGAVRQRLITPEIFSYCLSKQKLQYTPAMDLFEDLLPTHYKYSVYLLKMIVDNYSIDKEWIGKLIAEHPKKEFFERVLKKQEFESYSSDDELP